ncbi:hypothetical protein E2C01_007037 [Portunus trituberculatus]|uniref:Uncharacterized protein n=1 Tax=Portunus trituberculatus TaxID=210409 RepID=A0A5B7CZS9_PORTR|nr:hypothetical protein [Portunus trituberculatus]
MLNLGRNSPTFMALSAALQTFVCAGERAALFGPGGGAGVTLLHYYTGVLARRGIERPRQTAL